MSIPKSDHDAFAKAIETGDAELVLRLIKKHPELVNHPDWTPPPLHCAVLWNQPKILEILLDHGADIEIKDPDQKTTPLRYAILFAKKQIVQLLLSRGANAGPISDQGVSALHLAKEAASGAFESYEDLPPKSAYSNIVEILENAPTQ